MAIAGAVHRNRCCAGIQAFAWGCGVFFAIKYHIGLRVSDGVEFEGVNKHIHGTPCYPVEETLTSLSGGFVAEERE